MMVEYLAIGHRHRVCGEEQPLAEDPRLEDICRLCMTFPSIQILSSFKPVQVLDKRQVTRRWTVS